MARVCISKLGPLPLTEGEKPLDSLRTIHRLLLFGRKDCNTRTVHQPVIGMMSRRSQPEFQFNMHSLVSGTSPPCNCSSADKLIPNFQYVVDVRRFNGNLPWIEQACAWHGGSFSTPFSGVLRAVSIFHVLRGVHLPTIIVIDFKSEWMFAIKS
jgi:hypothetical protein